MSDLPRNVHVSKHPCLIAKISQLRSKNTSCKETEQLVHDITVMLGMEALASLELVEGEPDVTPIGTSYTPMTIATKGITLIPILRSGLSMVSAVQSLLPNRIPVHHLGLYREKTTLQPVEYYNNLPQSSSSSSSSFSPSATHASNPSTAILIDPVLATGGTAIAAIQILREWGVKRVIVINVIAARVGLGHAAAEWADATEFWIGAVDPDLTTSGMISPGLGDVGDRLFGTVGK